MILKNKETLELVHLCKSLNVTRLKPSLVVAYQITDETLWHYKEDGKAIVVVGDDALEFDHTNDVYVGDYIVFRDGAANHWPRTAFVSRFKKQYQDK